MRVSAPLMDGLHLYPQMNLHEQEMLELNLSDKRLRKTLQRKILQTQWQKRNKARRLYSCTLKPDQGKRIWLALDSGTAACFWVTMHLDPPDKLRCFNGVDGREQKPSGKAGMRQSPYASSLTPAMAIVPLCRTLFIRAFTFCPG